MKRYLALFFLATPVFGTQNPDELPKFFVEHFGRPSFHCAGRMRSGMKLVSPEVTELNYPGITWRMLSEQDEYMGSPFQSYRLDLPARSRILMSADGHSVGGLQYAQQGHLVTATNSQPFFAGRFSSLGDRNILKVVFSHVANQGGRFAQVANEPVEVVNRLAKIFNIALPGVDASPLATTYPYQGETWGLLPGVSPEAFFESMVDVENEVQKRIRALQSSGNFTYLNALTQDALANVPDGQYQMTVDLNGAFPTSLPRLPLLKDFFRTLAPGAKGFIADRGTDFVELTRPSSLLLFKELIEKNGGDRRILLRDYLKGRGEGVFDYYQHDIFSKVHNPQRGLSLGFKISVEVIVITGNQTPRMRTALDDLTLSPDVLMVNIGPGMYYPIGQYVEN